MQRRVLLVLFGTLLIDMIGLGMVFPIIPILFTDSSSPSFLLGGYSPSAQFFLAGAITALWGLMQFLAAPILGELSDAYGRKKLLVFGVGTLAVSQALFGFGVGIASVALLFVARALAGIAAGNLGIAQASIADVSEPKDRAKNFGLIGAAVGMGMILGPLLSGWLVHTSHNPALPFLMAGALGMLNALFLALLLPETNTQPKAAHTFRLTQGVRNIRSAIADNEMRRIYLTNFLYLFGFTTFTSFYGIFLVHMFGFSEAQVGTSFAVVGVCVVFTQLVILRALAKRYSEQTMLRYTIVLVGASIGISAFMPSAALFLAFIPLVAVPHALSLANIPALVSRSVSADKQGAALGINASLIALANGSAPIVMGVGSGLLGVHMPFVTAGFFILSAWCALFLPMSYFRSKEQKVYE
jgi:MFS transporter, DHA1 family, tetracycline resistance protein